MLISVEETVKHQLEPNQGSMGDAPVLSYYSLLRNPWPEPTCVLEHCREGEPIVGCPLFVAFPSNHIPKATKYFNVGFFIHSDNFCKFYQRIPETF
jgi:hypothetical protein